MKRLNSLTLAIGLMAAALLCRADEPERDVPWKALQEIARRGDAVEHVDGFQGPSDPIGDLMQPPADDSHKWFFTVVTTKGCAACERLKADFANAPALKPWADTADYKKSWSHWQVVDVSDSTQEWRWTNFKPRAFPTLIIQPPYNGSWGDPHTVVFLKEGYDGNAASLDKAIRAALTKYAQKVHPQHVSFQKRLAPLAFAGGFEQPPTGDWTPPFAPPSPTPGPQPSPYLPYPTIPPPDAAPAPAPAQSGQFLLYLLTFLTGTNLLVTLVTPLLGFLKTRAASTPGKIDDYLVAVLTQIVEAKLNKQNPAPS